tara:strand:+ start:57 stop:311 length:255 start_codon:yes stop_codon:yes gene_type:complete
MKSTNFVLVIISIMISFASAATECMYCKAMDTNAGFLYSYSYCPTSGLCVQDQWDKMNAWCDSEEGWIRGYKLKLDEDCGAETK